MCVTNNQYECNCLVIILWVLMQSLCNPYAILPNCLFSLFFIAIWTKSAHETSRMSSINQQNLDNTQDWQHLNNFCSFGPQSPQFHCHHSVNSDQNYNCRPLYYPSISSNQSGVVSNDHALLQQFIQTQQMLINSVCQFNQLLWDQQREINNLNTAVLLVCEIIFSYRSSKNNSWF